MAAPVGDTENVKPATFPTPQQVMMSLLDNNLPVSASRVLAL